MKISEFLSPSLIKISLEADYKDELFPEMVQLFVSSGLIDDRSTAIRVLEEREAKMSTGIAPGLGLPHAKLPEAKQTLMAMGISKKGIEYDSLDGEPVYVVICIFASGDRPGQHILALAEISRIFSSPDFMDKLRSAEDASEVLELIRAEE
jgi:PTS system nitrogen regulatory IIA component